MKEPFRSKTGAKHTHFYSAIGGVSTIYCHGHAYLTS